jgi:hypothetical protein
LLCNTPLIISCIIHLRLAVQKETSSQMVSLFLLIHQPPAKKNYELRTPLSYPSARSSPVHTTDDDNRWLSEQPLDSFSFPNVPSHATDPSAFLSHGTCRPSDLMLPPEIHNHQFTIDRPNPGDSFAIGQLAPYSPSGE